MARAKGISKATGYKARVFTAEYDLKGMVDAYGLEFVIHLAKLVAAGKVNCKQDVDRWSAHVALEADYAFNAYYDAHKHRFDNHLDDIDDADIDEIDDINQANAA